MSSAVRLVLGCLRAFCSQPHLLDSMQPSPVIQFVRPVPRFFANYKIVFKEFRLWKNVLVNDMDCNIHEVQ